MEQSVYLSIYFFLFQATDNKLTRYLQAMETVSVVLCFLFGHSMSVLCLSNSSILMFFNFDHVFPCTYRPLLKCSAGYLYPFLIVFVTIFSSYFFLYQSIYLTLVVCSWLCYWLSILFLLFKSLCLYFSSQ